MTNVINDLFDYEDLKIYQDDSKFKFSLDSILLAEFTTIKANTNLIVDFCTGNAPIPLILSTKTKAKIYGFEIQSKISELANLSITKNKLTNQISIINDNIKEVLKYLKPESVDIITCNPPYFKYDEKSSLINKDYEKAIARHEITLTLESIMTSAKSILKNKGSLYMVHRCDRLNEILNCLNKYNFKVKELQFIYTNIKKEAIMVLIKAIKNGREGNLKIMPPINILEYNSYQGIFERK